MNNILGWRPWIHGYTYPCGTQHTPVKEVSRIKYVQDGSVFVFGCLNAIHGFLQMRIKVLSDWFDALRSKLCNVVQQLLVDQLETLTEGVIARFASGRLSPRPAWPLPNRQLPNPRR